MTKTQRVLFSFIALFAAILPSIALADGHDQLDTGDTAWMLTSSVLVLMMTIPGLSLFYAGMVRSKNVLSVFMQCFTITCLMTVVWFAWGYSLAFSDGGPMNAFVGGLSNLFHANVGWDSMSGTIPETVFSMFQLTFAVITPALVCGAFAERMKFSALCWFAVLWVTIVYCPITHWVWGGGWLAEMGLLDFAGGTVVHLNCGIAALVAALVLGRRKGFPDTPMPPHNLGFSVVGASLLWVGWFGFNAGSALASGTGAGMAMLVTHIGAACGSLAWMFTEWMKRGKPSVLGIITGMVAGLGTITPASGFVGPAGAMIIGICAGVICFFATNTMKQVLHIDDSLDVMPVHGVGGITGTLLTGVFVGTLGGAGLAEGMTMGAQIGVQFVGIIAVAIYCGVMSFIIYKVIDLFIGLRVTSDEETEGLDIVLHDERGYDI
jgi:Amt family ammonium transporter